MMVSVSLMASESSLKRKRPPDDFYTPCGMPSGLTFQTELAKFSLANRASRESLSASDDVFHYTSADAFKEILSRGQIWLTNTAYLNDRNELRYPVELCQQIVQDKRDSYRLTLASLAQGGPPERSLLDRIHKEITLHEIDLPPRTSPPSKLDLGPLEVHSPEQNRVLVTWGVWPPAPEADRPRRCEAVSGCTPFATSRLAPLLPTTCRRSLH